MTLRIRMMGGFEVCREAAVPIAIPARKARALLALLARRIGQPIDREILATRLWPEATAEHARMSLRQALKQLRRSFGPAIRSEGNALVLDPASVEVDVTTFERLAERQSAEAWRQALDLYQGEFLDGVSLPSDLVSEWLTFERNLLRERTIGLLTRVVEDAPEPDAIEAGVRAAIRLLALDPVDEHVHRILMQLYLRQGRRSDAAAQYRICRDILRRELGVAPEPDTERLHESIPTNPEASSGASEPAAVAVLPFRNLTTDPEQLYFSDGLTEDIISALTRFRSFPVIARPSSFALRDEENDIADIGRMLGARYLLTGSVRRQDGRVRVSVLLSDSETGTHLWAEHYDREFKDIFAVQDEITQTVVAYVAPEISRAELKRSAAKLPRDLTAWDFVLRGMARLRDGTAAASSEARDFFHRALALQPDYVDALSGLAMTYKIDILLGVASDRRAAARKAIATARRAISLDPASSVAHQELGTAYQFLNRLDEALAEARVAVELNPYDPIGLHQLGNKSDLYGDPRGIGWMERAQRLNPLDVQFHPRLTFLARAYLNADMPDRAIERARRAIRRQPDYAPAHYILALALADIGQIEEGRAALARAEELQPGLVAERRRWTPYRDTACNAGLWKLHARLADGSVAARRK